MKRFLLPHTLLLGFGPVACDDDDDGDSGNDSSNATTAADDGGSAGDAAGDDGAEVTSSSMQTCDSSHQCINDVCECTTEGLEGTSCTDDDACVDECEVCV